VTVHWNTYVLVGFGARSVTQANALAPDYDRHLLRVINIAIIP
jgi:hypothetical protein